MPTDITTESGWNSYLDFLCKSLSERSQDSETEIAECSLVLTADPETGEAYGSPGIFVLLARFSGKTDAEVERAKADYATNLRMIALAGCAIGSVFRSEIWLAHSTPEEEKNTPWVQVKDRPNRKEALMLMVQHKDFGPQLRCAIIEKKKNGKRHIGEWDCQHEQLQGRFSSLLPPDDVLASKSAVELARMFARSKAANGDIVELDKFIEELRESSSEAN